MLVKVLHGSGIVSGTESPWGQTSIGLMVVVLTVLLVVVNQGHTSLVPTAARLFTLEQLAAFISIFFGKRLSIPRGGSFSGSLSAFDAGKHNFIISSCPLVVTLGQSA